MTSADLFLFINLCNFYYYLFLLESNFSRTLEFHPDGNFLFSGTQDMLHIFGWEPMRCYDTLSMAWGKVSDMSVANSQLIGAAFNQTNISVHVVDLSVSVLRIVSIIC